MEVILTKDVENVGREDDLVEVASGYGRNYLIPQGLAVVASSSAKKDREERIKQQEVKKKKQMEEAQKIAAKLEDTVIEIGAKTGDGKKIFGTITPLQLAESIKDQAKIEVDRKYIDLLEEPRKLGTYKARVEVHRDVEAEVSFEVVKE